MNADAELLGRVAELEARLAQLAPPPPPPAYVPVSPPSEPKPVPVYTLQGNSALPRDPRELRQLIEAVAIAQGVASPSQTVPAGWVLPLRRVAAVRAQGRSWGDALVEAGLAIPDDLEVQALAVKTELGGLWDRLLPLVGMTLHSVNDPTKDALKGFLRRALT